jgi:hypothetical protein
VKFAIKPVDDSLDLLLEANQYRNLWQSNSRKLLKAFRDITGLNFQQYIITAHVFKGDRSIAGRPHHPMMLAGDYRSENFKLATIVHELSHRLLGGNGLGIISLGLVNEPDANSDFAVELDHRHLYLFEYDVMRLGLGNEWGVICKRYEERDSNEINNPHIRAWKWAMSFSYKQRQEMLKVLTAKKVERDRWDEWWGETITPIAPSDWKKQLIIATGQKHLHQ